MHIKYSHAVGRVVNTLRLACRLLTGTHRDAIITHQSGIDEAA